MKCELCLKRIGLFDKKVGSCHEGCLDYCSLDLPNKEFKKRLKILREAKEDEK